MRFCLKKIILTLLLVCLVVSSNAIMAFADGTGSSGESDSSESSGASNTHEFPQRTAVTGYRVYLVPNALVFDGDSSNGYDIAEGSEFERYSMFAVYSLYKTNSDGSLERVAYKSSDSENPNYNKNSSTVWDFNSSNQTVDNFLTLAYGENNQFVKASEYDIYSMSGVENEFMEALNKVTVESYRMKGKPQGSGDVLESALNTQDGNKFYTETDTSIGTRNWAVFDGNQKFFEDVISKIEEEKDMKSLISSFASYVVEQYGYDTIEDLMNECGLQSDYMSDILGVVVEPVYGYVNENIKLSGSIAPVLMTSTQYARWALGKNDNYYDAHGIAYWYDKASSSNITERSRDASYIYSRTIASNATMQYSLTAYNFFSTLRPYREINEGTVRGQRLNEYGGIGLIDGGNSEVMTLAALIEYSYKYAENAESATVDSNPVGGYGTNVKGDQFTYVNKLGNNENVIDTPADKLSSYDLIGESETVTKYYTFLVDFAQSIDSSEHVDLGAANTEGVDISAFVEEYGNESEEAIAIALKSKILYEIQSNADLSEITIKDDGQLSYAGLPVNERIDYKRSALLKNTIVEAFQKLGLSVTDSQLVTWNNTTRSKTYTQEDANRSMGEIADFTTQYSGAVTIHDNGVSKYASGTVPVTVGISTNLPSVESFLREYIVEYSEDSTPVITLNESTRFPEQGDVIGITLGLDNEYDTYAMTFANRDFSSGDFIESDVKESKYSREEMDSKVEEILVNSFVSLLDERGSVDGNFSNEMNRIITTRLSSSALATFIKVSETNNHFNMPVWSSSYGIAGTQAVVIKVKKNALNSNIGDNSSVVKSSMKEYELNKFDNFYIVPPNVITNKLFVRDPEMRLLTNTNTVMTVIAERLGLPSIAPMIGGYGVESGLNSTGISKLKPVFTWESTRKDNFLNYMGAETILDISQKMYVLSRAKLGDIKNIADYSYWNRTQYKPTEVVSGSKTAKQVLAILGNNYDTKPAIDKSEENGKKGELEIEGSLGTQNLLTSEKAGWKVTDTYDKYTRRLVTGHYWADGSYHSYSYYTAWALAGHPKDIQYVPGQFLFGDNSTSWDYGVNFLLRSYIPFTVSSNVGSSFTFNNNIKNTEKDSSKIGASAIAVPSDNRLVNLIEFGDKSTSVLGVYPEVLMMYYTHSSDKVTYGSETVNSNHWYQLGDEYQGYSDGYVGIHTGDAVSSFTPKSNYVYTVGEKVRYFNPTAYMTMEVYGDTNKSLNLIESDISGSLTSTAFSTSSKIANLLNTMSVDSKTPVILSGGNYNISTLKKLKLELTTYAVDIAGNGDGVTSSTTNSELNMKEVWGSIKDNRTYLAENVHINYVTGVLSGIDQKLNIVVNTDAGTVDKELVDRESINSVAGTSLEKTYNILIRLGSVANKDEIINNIATDLIAESTNTLTLSEATAQAEKIYNGLQIEDMVITQLESRGDSSNKSEKDVSDGNWYDESVSTIVIRKYISTVDVGTVNASDKIDISWGTSQKVGSDDTKASSLYTSGYKAGFKYTLMFKDSKFKLPSGSEIDIAQPIVRGMLLNGNFVVPDASINDSKY